MIKDTSIANRLVDYLLQIKAIKLQPKNPFTWASGIQSPIYCDNRIILSHPEVRDYVVKKISEQISEKSMSPDIIVGVATGAIAMGVLVAQELNLPFAYVRASGKGHGLKNQIEGDVSSGQNALVIEDLISTGGSSILAVDVLRDAGCKVTDMMAIFTYGFDKAKDLFEKKEVQLHTLADYATMLDHALETEYISLEEASHLKTWRKSPETWINN